MLGAMVVVGVANAPGIRYCLAGTVETGGLLCPEESPFESESDATKKS